MKVILTEKVPTLGNIGEIVNVSAGHARNYLVPNGFAMVADESNKRLLAAQQKSLGKKIQAQRDAANETKKKIEGLTIELIKKVGASGKLFGTVTNAELSKELENRGLTVERRLIHLDAPIKGLGIFTAKAKIFQDIEATFKIKVAIDPKQAEELKLAQEEALKAAEARKKAAADAKAAGDSATPVAEMTEEQRLKMEVDKLLRS
ncbi:50S ribosomal protein L9 [Bacteriovorax stolpii]|uniref:50S ribosomal protein L9 n=1 Tax=Bacteriovorax stolpii TaxID=960 RepID=UPI00115BDF6D|nr:50S ribosomal protein L9 [Bacteriovorax stolpii]QDK42896.1 50S ribosomal protein L9 [Bacteriovorax stolpii]